MQFLRQNTFNSNLHILFPKKSECLNSFEPAIIYYNTFLKKDCRALRYAPICWKCFFVILSVTPGTVLGQLDSIYTLTISRRKSLVTSCWYNLLLEPVSQKIEKLYEIMFLETNSY